MHRICILIVCFLVIAGISGHSLAADKKTQTKSEASSTTASTAQQANVDIIANFQKSWAWKHVDPDLQNAWIAAMQQGQGDTRFQCFVRIKDVMDWGDQSFLESNGFRVRIAEGNIVRGDVAAKDLQGVAELPFVGSIKLSSPAQ